jgi:hypothetical protein
MEISSRHCFGGRTRRTGTVNYRCISSAFALMGGRPSIELVSGGIVLGPRGGVKAGTPGGSNLRAEKNMEAPSCQTPNHDITAVTFESGVPK